MQLFRHQDTATFLAEANGFLISHEAENNLLFGILKGIEQGIYTGDNYLATVKDGAQVVLAALRTPPYNVVLSYQAPTPALELLAADLLAAGHAATLGVVGPKAASLAFAEIWQNETGRTFSLEMAQRIYKLERVHHPQGVEGNMRRATEAENDLLVAWIKGFMVDAFHDHDVPDINQHAQNVVNHRMGVPPQHGGLCVWVVGGQPVSLAGYTGLTPHGIRVGPVYTPPEQRRRGYAGALVAALSQWLLEQGRQFCFLFTDLANPTSNHIYQEVGYEAVCDVDVYHFAAMT